MNYSIHKDLMTHLRRRILTFGLFSVYLYMSNGLFAQKRYEQFAKYEMYDSLLLIAQNTHVDSLKASTLNRLADLIHFQVRSNDNGRDYKPALYYANMALSIAKKINNKAEVARSMNLFGKVAADTGNYSAALYHHFATIKIAEEIQDKKCIRNQHYLIGNIYTKIGDFHEALKHQYTMLKMIKELGESGPPLFFAYRAIGISNQKLGNLDEALDNFFSGYKEAVRSNVSNAKGIFYIYIGNVYKEKGDYDESLKYHLASLEDRFVTNTNADVAPSYIGIGLVYLKKAKESFAEENTKNYKEALAYLHKGLESAKAAGLLLRPVLLDAYLGLAEAYSSTEDFKNALFYSNQYMLLKDSLLNAETIKKISKLQVQYEMENKQLEERALQQLALTEEKALRERLLSNQKLEAERILLKQQADHEIHLIQQKNQQDKFLTQQKTEHDKSIAIEKEREEKLSLEKQRMNGVLIAGILGISIISGLLFLLLHQRNQKRRVVEKTKTLHKMAELELQSLRAQLNPHFMFNSLNAIQELILKEENENSHLYLSRFADLLRMLLDNANEPFISLKREFEFLELYLAMEKLRIPNLNYSFEIDDNIQTSSVLLPNMILQPYIENALWHGLSHKKGERNLFVRARKNDSAILFEIEDNGVGRQRGMEFKTLFRKGHKSKGMELLSKRYELIAKEYDGYIRTTVTDLLVNEKDSVGTLVEISLPVTLIEKVNQRLYDTGHYN